MTCFAVVPIRALPAFKRFVRPLFQGMLFLLLLNVLAADAQVLAGLEQGINPYASYEGGEFDSISMVNGSLAFHIPLISYPQRGNLHMGFSLAYANPILQPYASCNPNTHLCSSSGYTVDYRGLYVLQSAITLVPDFAPTVFSVGSQVKGPFYYTVTDFDGAVHDMGEIANGSWESVDTTGYNYSPTTNILTDRKGNQYNTQTGTLQDTNGNFITESTNGQGVVSWTDTLGRVIPKTMGTGNISSCPNTPKTPTSASLWSVPGPNGGVSNFVLCYTSVAISFTAPDCNASNSHCQPTSYPATLLQNIVLPNNTNWSFAYDSFGEPTTITLPTGGTISYTWTYTSGLCVGPDYVDPSSGVNTFLLPYGRAVTSRTVNANDGTGPHEWTYVMSSYVIGGNIQTVVTDPASNTTVHSETAQGGACTLRESELDQYNGSTSGTLLKKVATTYNSTYGGSDFMFGDVGIDVVPNTITTTDSVSGMVSKVVKTFDSGVACCGGYTAIYGDLLTQSDFDFGIGSPGALLRTTTDTYMVLTGPNSSTYAANNLLDLPYTVLVRNSGGAQVGYTTYGYDESGLQTSNVTEQKTTGESYPGNQTSVHRWLNGSTVATTNCNVSVSNGYLVSKNVFYDTGKVQSSTDPCNYATTYQYSPTYYGAFPTTVTNALGQSTNYGYDFNSGSVTSIQDPNLQSTYGTYDIMNRLTHLSYPDGGSTKYCYTDGVPTGCPGGNAGGAPFAVVITQAITSTPALNEISTRTFDGLGRLSQTQLNSDIPSTTYTLTSYDPLGRKSQVYNPTRCSSITMNCDSESTWGVTTYTLYDALNRVKTVTEQDGSVVNSTYDQSITNIPAVCTIVTDEAGHSRESCVDGLGRMTSLWEDPGSSPHLNYETTYQYDALNNLTNVTQYGSNSANARVRNFAYDSLSHLTSAQNPESGTILYAYDADGNVITKTAPLPNQTGSSIVTTTSTFDQLNRLTGKMYSDGITPTDYYTYDTAPGGTAKLTNLVGRVVTSSNQYGGGTSGQATATYYSYDAMGRIIREFEQTPSVSPNGAWVCETYDLAGNLASINPAGLVMAGNATGCNPSGTVISYAHNAANRLSAITSSLSNAQHPATLYSLDPSLGYYPNGAIRKASFGNGLTDTLAFNSRLQPCRMNVNSAGGYFSQCTDAVPSGNLLDLTVGYNAGSSDNGNAALWSAVGNQTFSRSYGYDSLNRIKTMADSASGQACKGLSWTIDAWGNMTAQTTTGGTCYTFSSSVGTNNQLQSGYQYDAAGNMTYDGSHHYTYDAENRIVQMDSGSTASYVYNENGKRARRNTGSGFTEYFYGSDGSVQNDYNGTWAVQYVYGGIGLVAEYINNTTEFLHKDHLGSTRLVTAVNESVVDSMDYVPFGQQTAGASATTHKFTGKERDAESGLDNFEARYLGSSLGRFMSPDPMGGDTKDPQSLNRYAYVRNNPLKLTDPTGLNFNLGCSGPDTATCQGGLQGTTTTTTTTDANGNQTTTSTFTATEISNDKNGNLVDQNGNHYSGTFDGTNVSFTQNGSTQSSTGVWKEGSDPTSGITGGGALDDSFHFTFAQHGTGQKLNAFGYHVGSPEDAIRKLGAAGIRFSMLDTIFNLREMVDHPGALNFRSSGDPGTGANSTHLLLDRTPSATVPWAQTFNLHTGETNPTVSGQSFLQHIGNEQ